MKLSSIRRVLLMTIFGGAIAAGSGPALAQAPVEISIGETATLPAVGLAVVGQEVRWTNATTRPQAVSFDQGQAGQPNQVILPAGVEPFDSGSVAGGRTWSHTFTAPGRYRYLLRLAATQYTGELVVMPPLPADTVVINIEGRTFVPAQVTVFVGQNVRWVNLSPMTHTVTADKNLARVPDNVLLPPGAAPFDSGSIPAGAIFERRFEVEGDYRYICRPHELMGHKAAFTVIPAPPPVD